MPSAPPTAWPPKRQFADARTRNHDVVHENDGEDQTTVVCANDVSGRGSETIAQVDARNLECQVIVAKDEGARLKDLLPRHWLDEKKIGRKRPPKPRVELSRPVMRCRKFSERLKVAFDKRGLFPGAPPLDLRLPSTAGLAQGHSPPCIFSWPEATSKRSASSGSGGWGRTSDQRINSPLRYHCATPEQREPFPQRKSGRESTTLRGFVSILKKSTNLGRVRFFSVEG